MDQSNEDFFRIFDVKAVFEMDSRWVQRSPGP